MVTPADLTYISPSLAAPEQPPFPYMDDDETRGTLSTTLPEDEEDDLNLRMSTQQLYLRMVPQTLMMTTIKWKVCTQHPWLTRMRIAMSQVHPQQTRCQHHRKGSPVLRQFQLSKDSRFQSRLQRSNSVGLQLQLPMSLILIVMVLEQIGLFKVEKLLVTPQTLICICCCGSRLQAAIMYVTFPVFIMFRPDMN